MSIDLIRWLLNVVHWWFIMLCFIYSDPPHQGNVGGDQRIHITVRTRTRQQSKYGLYQVSHIYVDEKVEYVEHELYPDVYKNEPGEDGKKVKADPSELLPTKLDYWRWGWCYSRRRILISIASNMENVEHIIGVGDGHQFAPVVRSHKQKNLDGTMVNEFAESQMQPLILRAQKAGLRVSMLHESYRARQGWNSLLLFYFMTAES